MSLPNFNPENYKYTGSSDTEDNFDPENFKSSSGKPMVNTFLGKMAPPEEFVKKTESPEFVDQLIRRSLSATSSVTPLNALGALIKRTASMLPIAAATKDLSPLEQKFSEAKDLSESTSAEHKAAQDQASVMGQSRNPNTVQSKILQNQNRLDQLHESLANKPPILPSVLPESEANLQQVQQAHDTAQQVSQDTEKAIGEHLNVGTQHDVNAARQIKETQDKIRQNIGRGYDELEKKFSEKNIQIDNSGRHAELNSQLLKLLRENKTGTPEGKQLLDELSSMENQTTINAGDYLRAYRSSRQLAREARQKAYKPGMNAEERNDWMQRYNELEDKVEEMGNVLENSVGKDDYNLLHGLNKQWRTQVVPLQRNTIFQRIQKSSQMPENIIHSLRGDEPGNMLLRNIIQKDPEILRNVVGQRYATRPKEIFNPNETTASYLDKMPELQKLLRQREQGNVVTQRTSQNLENTQRAHSELEKETQKRIAERAAQHEEANQLQETIAKQEKIIKELRRTTARRNLSLEEKTTTENALKKAQKIKAAAQKRLSTTGLVASGLAGVTGLYHVAKHFLSSGNEE